MNNYLKAHGMTWADVKYPSLAPGAGGYANAISNTASMFGMTYALRRMYR